MCHQDIGTHSIRKGAATYCCAGVHPGPPVISVCLRAGWSVGRVKERYLKYENAGDELVGRTLTGIPPTSCKFGISPVYFDNNKTNEHDIENLVAMCFPLAKESLIGLTYVLSATFICHEEWTVAHTRNQDSPLLHSTYFSIHNAYPNRKAFTTTALPWEDKPSAPSLTGIPIHCSLLNKLMELTEMQKALPQIMLQKFIAELDECNMGGGLNAQRILDGIKQSNDELKQILLNKFGSQQHSIASGPSGVVQNTFLNTGTTLTNPSMVNTNDVPLLNSDNGIWGHYWENKIRLLPQSFRFPPKKTLLSLWLSWHVPDVSRKVCPYKVLKTSDVMHMVRGQNKLLEMKMVIEVLISKIREHEAWYNRYLRGIRNIHELSEIFDAFKNVYKNILNAKRKARFGQLSWESSVRDARLIKHKVAPSYTFHPPPFIEGRTSDQERSPSTTPVIQRTNNPISIIQDEVENSNDTITQRRLLQQTTPPIIPTDDNSKKDESSNSTSSTRILTRGAKKAIIQQRTMQTNLVTPLRRKGTSTASRYLKKRTPTKSSKSTKATKSSKTNVKKDQVYKKNKQILLGIVSI